MALPQSFTALGIVSLSSYSRCFPHNDSTTFYYSPSLYPKVHSSKSYKPTRNFSNYSFRHSYRFFDAEDEDNRDDYDFEAAVALFNDREYYKCHDFLEALWNDAQEPTRTLIHGILQCAVGFHHLFNQNHKGAMMELGEGLCKLRKMDFESGPFHEFEREISAALDFIYKTQIELAACTDDICLAMDQSERSYQLLGGYGAGQHLYSLQIEADQVTYITFCPQRSYCVSKPSRVKLPVLNATKQHLIAYEYK